MFKRLLAERGVEVHNEKDVVDVRDPPEGVDGATGTLVCKDGSEASVVHLTFFSCCYVCVAAGCTASSIIIATHETTIMLKCWHLDCCVCGRALWHRDSCTCMRKDERVEALLLYIVRR